MAQAPSADTGYSIDKKRNRVHVWLPISLITTAICAIAWALLTTSWTVKAQAEGNTRDIQTLFSQQNAQDNSIQKTHEAIESLVTKTTATDLKVDYVQKNIELMMTRGVPMAWQPLIPLKPPTTAPTTALSP